LSVMVEFNLFFVIESKLNFWSWVVGVKLKFDFIYKCSVS